MTHERFSIMTVDSQLQQLGRRAFLRGGTLLLATAATTDLNHLLAAEDADGIRVGVVTDLHHADKAPGGSRYYRETLTKLKEARKVYADQQLDFIVELGDLIDAASSVEVELGYLKTVNAEFSKIAEKRYYVLGNHCVDTLTKQEFLGEVGQGESYFSFDQGDVHFVVLDSCFRSDGTPYQRKNFTWTDANIPEQELSWLRADLKKSDKPTIVFAHQRLDVSNSHGVKNCAEVRQILEESGNVLAVFQGHSHQNDHKEIGGIHYCTMVAMIEGSGEQNNAYSVLQIGSNGTLQITGFRKQKDYRWMRT